MHNLQSVQVQLFWYNTYLYWNISNNKNVTSPSNILKIIADLPTENLRVTIQKTESLYCLIETLHFMFYYY